MRLEQLHDTHPSANIVVDSHRSRTGKRSAVRIGARSTMPPLAANPGQVDAARRWQASNSPISVSPPMHAVPPSTQSETQLPSEPRAEDAWLNDTMPLLQPASHPPTQPETHVLHEQKIFVPLVEIIALLFSDVEGGRLESLIEMYLKLPGRERRLLEQITSVLLQDANREEK